MRVTTIQRCKRGAALMAVLWLIAILAIASITALRVIAFDMDIATSAIFGGRARNLAEMGIAVASHPLVKRHDPILRQQHGEESYEARILSEGSRFNINHILKVGDRDLLLDIFAHWGMELEESEALVDALNDWVDADNNVGLEGAEEEYYEQIGRLNQPFNRLFYSLDEMRLVRGMDRVEAYYPEWRDWFTIWSSGPLDLNEAPVEFIAVAADCPVEQAVYVRDAVYGEDMAPHTEDDVLFQNPGPALDLLGIDPEVSVELANRFTVNDPTIRIESIGQAADARRMITVILRNRTGRPALLARTEEILP